MDHTHGENRTSIVTVVTVLMMLVEVVAGLTSQSMALLADGLHMASHTVAFAVTLFAYRYARRHANNPTFTFGTGKVNALGGFTGAITLNLFALWMAWESIERVITPSRILYSEAMAVAAIGLVVNACSAYLLRDDHRHGDSCRHHDHNLRSAYLHVLGDAATSVVAILALLLSQRLGLAWLDPLAGVLGALVITSWSISLVRDSASILLDHEGPERLQSEVLRSIKNEHVEITDWHCWAIGSGHYAAVLSLDAHIPITAREIRSRIPNDPTLVHLTIEINRADGETAPFSEERCCS